MTISIGDTIWLQDHQNTDYVMVYSLMLNGEIYLHKNTDNVQVVGDCVDNKNLQELGYDYLIQAGSLAGTFAVSKKDVYLPTDY